MWYLLDLCSVYYYCAIYQKKRPRGFSDGISRLPKRLAISWCQKCGVWMEIFPSVHLVLNTLSTWPINLKHVISCAFSSSAKVERQLWCFWLCFGGKKTPGSGAGCSSTQQSCGEQRGFQKIGLISRDGILLETKFQHDLKSSGEHEIFFTWETRKQTAEKWMELCCIYRDYVIAVVPADACCSLSGTTNQFCFFL